MVPRLNLCRCREPRGRSITLGSPIWEPSVLRKPFLPRPTDFCLAAAGGISAAAPPCSSPTAAGVGVIGVSLRSCLTAAAGNLIGAPPRSSFTAAGGLTTGVPPRSLVAACWFPLSVAPIVGGYRQRSGGGMAGDLARGFPCIHSMASSKVSIRRRSSSRSSESILLLISTT